MDSPESPGSVPPAEGSVASSSAPTHVGAGSTGPFDRFAAWVDAWVQHAVRWGWLFVLIGLAPGLTIWPLLNLEELGYILDGKLERGLRVEIVWFMLASASMMAGLYLGAFLAFRRRVRVRFADVAVQLNRYMFVIVAMPLVTTLMYRGLEGDHPFLTLLLIAIVTGFAAVFIYRVLGIWDAAMPADHVGRGRRWPWITVVGLMLFLGGYVTYLALLDHRNLGTHVFDLGIYDNIVWHTANGDFLGCSYCKTGKHMSSHFDPILLLVAMVYRVVPRAETLLVFQSFWLSTGVFPLFLIVRRRLQNPSAAVSMCVLYVLYPALHGVSLFDFHSLSLVVPTLLWVVYALDSGRNRLYWPMLGLMLLTREDMSLLACFVGAYALLGRRIKLGLVTIVVSLTYLAVVKGFVMNDPGLLMAKDSESTSFHHFYSEMIPHREEGMKGLVVTFLTNPVFSLLVLLKEPKVFFFLALLMPVLGLPLLSGRKTIMMLYGLVFIGAASRKYVFSLYFQYSSVLFPILLASVPDGLLRVGGSRVVAALGWGSRRVMWTLLWTCLVCTLLVTHKYGAFWPNDAFRAGWNRMARAPSVMRQERYAFVRRMATEVIPPDAGVSASSALGPHVSSRESVIKWPKTKGADYLLLYTGSFKPSSRRRLDRLVARGIFRKIAAMHDVEVYVRVPEGDRSAEAARASKSPRPAGRPHDGRAGPGPHEDPEAVDDDLQGGDERGGGD